MTEYKYGKKIQKSWARKLSGGNYGTVDAQGSMTVELKFDDPDQYGQMLQDMYAQSDLDDELIKYIESKKDIYIQLEPAKLKPDNVVTYNTETNPPPKPKGRASIDGPLLKIDEYQSVSAYLESVGFRSKTWPDDSVSYSRLNEAGIYIAIGMTKAGDRTTCKVGGEYYKVGLFGDDTDTIYANVSSIWDRTKTF